MMEESIDSVKKFLQIKEHKIYTSTLHPNRWIYRGIKDFNYALIPSIGRLLSKEPFTSKEKFLEFEQLAFSEIRSDVYSELREVTNSCSLLLLSIMV